MKKNSIAFCILLFCLQIVVAQKKDRVLLTIDDKPVYSKEFKRVFKKNLDLVQDDSQKSVDGYLDLFIDYKLKITEAYAQGLHMKKDYLKEFAKYEEQLSRNYIFEDKVTEDLAREAYERGLEEIKAAHILVMSSYDDKPQDTLVAYKKIDSIRTQLLKTGEDFEAVAKKVSEEPNVEKTGGNLGYFSVFSLVYPFETTSYATPVGNISEIVRTQFGYHIIKVLDRRERSSELTVSHIMITDKKGDARTFNPKERINEISKLLQQGETFEQLAELYSDDKNSAKRGGKLTRFGKGDLRSPEFEVAAYGLENPGDISEPIKSDFGWHIIRLEEKHSQASFEEKKEGLEKRVAEGSRSKMVTNAVNKLIKEKFGFKKGAAYLPYFETLVGDEVLNRRWEYDTIAAADDKVIFTIGEHNNYFSDFAEYISERQGSTRTFKQKGSLLAELYDEFETQELKRYFKTQLEQENDEYAGVISEYRDGLLIFDVMNRNIWSKVRKDSAGLRDYYENNKEQYVWKQRVGSDIISAVNPSMAAQAAKLLKAGKTADAVKKTLNVDNIVNVIVTIGIFEIDAHDLPPNFKPELGVSEVYQNGESHVVVNVRDMIPPGTKRFKDIKGRVMSDYQNQLEANWLEELRKKYTIEVDKKTLKKVKKELKA